MTRRTATITAITLAATLVGLAACGDDDLAGPTTTGSSSGSSGSTEVSDGRLEEVRADLAPREYYDDYDDITPQCARESSAPTGGGDMAVEDAAAPTPDAESQPAPPEWDIPEVTEENTFDDVGDTGFVPTETDDQSTFGLDVDTGSYRVAQRFADEGYQPPADSIRTEEWINAFDYGYEAPTDADLGLTTMTGAAPHTPDGTRLVSVGVSSRDVTDENRPSANITFVIDTSGSMDIRERLGLVKSSLALLVEHLRPDDSISIVEFGSEARPVLPPTPVAQADEIVTAIDDLAPCGSTNMESGLKLGYEQAREVHDDEKLNVVVLAGDGVANVGVTDHDELSEDIEQQGRDGISLVTVGFGMGNYNDTMMEQLADQGDGFYSYVNTFEEAERLFVDELNPTLTTIAKDAKIQVTFDAEVVESYRLIGYENRAIADEDFDNDEVDAGEIGAGHTVTALYEVRLHDPDATNAKAGNVALRWESVATGKVEETSSPIEISARDDDNKASLSMAATVAYTAELLRENSAITARQLTLDTLLEDAEALENAGHPGAEDLADYLEAVQDLPKADD